MFWGWFRPWIHPQIDPQGTNWGWIGYIPYLWIKLDQISFEWTFLENNKIKMPNFHFGDYLDPEFIPKLIPTGTDWGWIGYIPYLWIKSDQISFEWTFLANIKIEMANSYFMDDLDSKFIPKSIQWGWIWDKPYL